VLLSRIVPLIILSAIAFGCSDPGPVVVVYTSVDQFYSEPVLHQFESETGIRTLPVFDVEAVKTTGLVQRLLSESDHPQADVFWNNEFIQTIFLADAGILAPLKGRKLQGVLPYFQDSSGCWAAFGCRYRVFLATAGLLDPPRSLKKIPQALFHLRVGMAHPSFGTTATWAASLRAQWGAEESRAFLQQLSDGGIRTYAGNSVVRDMVVSGTLDLGLTDSDDACAALAAGAPLQIILATQGMGGPLVVPGSVGLIRGAPHPNAARQFIDWLLRSEIEDELIQEGAFQASVRSSGPRSPCLGVEDIPLPSVSLQSTAEALADSQEQIREIFLR